MNLDLKYILLLYILFIGILYTFKPTIFDLQNTKNKKKKAIYLSILIIIIAIISFYIKVLIDWFF
jgi:uncharacterized membrane protein